MHMEVSINIRKYTAADRTGLISLWENEFPDDPPHNKPSIVIDSKLKVDDLIFVAEKDGNIIGSCMAGYDGHRGWLYSVAVLSSEKRCGLGTQLVKHAMSYLKGIGCVKINLQIRSTNTQVAAFYESLGFSVEDRLSMGVFL